MIKPRKLNKGDRVAVLSLSSGILGEKELSKQLDIGVKRLKELNLEPVFMTNALKGVDYIKNNPQKRAEDLKDAFKDDSIKGIICAIGGDDTYKTIPFLMEDNEFRNLVITKPKVFIGFSDSTNNHLMFNKLGLVTYYGLNFLSDLCELQNEMLPYTKASYQRLFNNPSSFEITPSQVWYLNRKEYNEKEIGVPLISKREINGLEFINGKDIIKGSFWGGCLDSIYDIFKSERYSDQRAVYERYNLLPEPSFFKDKILFLETSEEKPCPKKFEEMLDILIDEQIIQNVKCLLVGKPDNEVYYNEYKEVLLKKSYELNLPIVYNVNFGHSLPRALIPYGINGEIDFNKRKIIVAESIFKE